MKNGKKICWNYRKGRCRFGSNCTYAHDSDLHVNDKINDMDKDGSAIPATGIGMSQTTSTIAPNAAANVTAAGGVGGGGGAAITIGKLKSKTTSNNKKRPGLGDSIIPSKKVIKAYNALKK